eukprot:NODE_545_length_6876_cov_0.237013.p4 type:complete len:148 gc:universal NODE_545_length_6876_cov_0.237013:135-578(+)
MLALFIVLNAIPLNEKISWAIRQSHALGLALGAWGGYAYFFHRDPMTLNCNFKNGSKTSIFTVNPVSGSTQIIKRDKYGITFEMTSSYWKGNVVTTVTDPKGKAVAKSETPYQNSLFGYTSNLVNADLYAGSADGSITLNCDAVTSK